MCAMHWGTLDNTVFHISIHVTSCEGGVLVRNVLERFHNEEKLVNFLVRFYEYTDLQVSVFAVCRYQYAEYEVP